MSDYQHPAKLGAFRRYKQATSFLKKTTRAKDPAWYQDPLELSHQWHIRCDGTSCIAYFFDRNSGQWSQGVMIPDALLEDPEQRRNFIRTTVRDAQLRIPAALGIVVYLANDFATNELKNELDNPGALPELRITAATEPLSILEDSSLDASGNSFRLLPYPAGHGVIATAVTHTRQYADFLDDLREVAGSSVHPVVVKAVSAPLTILMGLPSLMGPPSGKAFVSILQYPWFTVIAFFNEHSDLMLIRTIQHKGIRRVGSMRAALTASCASLELVDPDVFVIPLAEQLDDTIEQRIRSVLPSSQITVVPPSSRAKSLPVQCKEMAILAHLGEIQAGNAQSHTFETLRSDGWALQDFLPMPREQQEIYPRRGEMRLLKLLRRARLAIIVIALLLIALQAKHLYGIMQQEEWRFEPSQANVTKGLVEKLTLEQQQVYHWNNMLEDRSKGWVAMEAFARLVTDKYGMLAKTYSHTVKPDIGTGQARVGLVKEWKISGLARDESLPFLNYINTRDGLNSFFKEIANVTGNRAYLPTVGNRSLTVNLRTLENAAFKTTPIDQALSTDESTYPFTFDLTITQRFEATDPMAVNISKAP